MPYRQAHWWVLACLGVILLGFWPSYWSVVGTSPWQFHLHGLVATSWVVLVAAQVWSAHNKKWPLHRATGQSSLYLFPFLIMGLTGIGMLNAQRFAAGDDPFLALYGDAFFIGTMIAIAAYVTLFYSAMKYRRKVWSHSAYLLGTPMILFESPGGRALNNNLPMFNIQGPQDFHIVLDSILICDGLMVALAMTLWWRARERSNAFAVVASFIAAQMVLMYGAYNFINLDALVVAFAQIPTAVALAVGLGIGAATSWLGWQAGKTPAKVAAPQAA